MSLFSQLASLSPLVVPSPCGAAESEECVMEVSARKNCGYPGISPEDCAARNCCFSDTIPEVPWCFFPMSVEGRALGTVLPRGGGSRAGVGVAPGWTGCLMPPSPEGGRFRNACAGVGTRLCGEPALKAIPECSPQGQLLSKNLRPLAFPSCLLRWW